MRIRFLVCASLALAQVAAAQQDPSRAFSENIRPVLMQNCAACHKPEATRGPAPFLKAATVSDMEANRGLWRNVASQLRNRTMPPAASKLTEEDRLRVSTWIEDRLKQTACNAGDFAGAAVTRRLNRREYRNTIRDLFGIDYEVTGILPADGTGGAGFDTNGETLYVPPMLTERYMEAAQQILDRVIVTPQLSRTFSGPELHFGNGGTTRALQAGEEVAVSLPAYVEGSYDLAVVAQGGSVEPKLVLKIDGVEAGALVPQRRRIAGMQPGAVSVVGIQVNLARGSHKISVIASAAVAGIDRLIVQQRQEPASSEKRALHYRLFGMEPGERPTQPRKAARQVLATFVSKAFRRPVETAALDRFLIMYDRAAERGDPYEERVKLALKAVLVWPEFLFRVEQKHAKPGIYPLTQHELATRLSYFLWSTMPDEPLLRLADKGQLQDPVVLAAEVERMLDDNRARAFMTSFIGQWLGTQDVGGRVAPLITELQSYYTPEVAADLRMQPILMFDRILGENRSLLDILTADYTYMTQRLARFYQMEEKITGLDDSEFRLVQWPDERRAGVLGLGAVLAMTSRYKETSPVLRGAWALDTLLGTSVPPPPPDVPPLKTDAELGAKLGMREKLSQHRADPACAACHKLMDPIGLGLENFDWMGRWRDTEDDGKLVDASGELPSGEKFNGPVELRQALLTRKDEFVGNLAGRVLGYALGRSLQDGDSCTIDGIAKALAKDNYRARTLIREIVLSVPFRNTQGGVVDSEHHPVISKRALDVSKLNALKQDAASHNIVAGKPVDKPQPASPKP
jgi:cytochrome c553